MEKHIEIIKKEAMILAEKYKVEEIDIIISEKLNGDKMVSIKVEV